MLQGIMYLYTCAGAKEYYEKKSYTNYHKYKVVTYIQDIIHIYNPEKWFLINKKIFLIKLKNFALYAQITPNHF